MLRLRGGPARLLREARLDRFVGIPRGRERIFSARSRSARAPNARRRERSAAPRAGTSEGARLVARARGGRRRRAPGRGPVYLRLRRGDDAGHGTAQGGSAAGQGSGGGGGGRHFGKSEAQLKMEALKEGIDTFLLYDFFVILFILSWLIVGVLIRLSCHQGLAYDEPFLGCGSSCGRSFSSPCWACTCSPRSSLPSSGSSRTRASSARTRGRRGKSDARGCNRRRRRRDELHDAGPISKTRAKNHDVKTVGGDDVSE